MHELITWKNMTSNRMPLVLYGVRQVGKTYILREFGDRFFDNTIYINWKCNILSPELLIIMSYHLSTTNINISTTRIKYFIINAIFI